MAALANCWGASIDQEGTTSGRRRTRRESEERQRYRQYPLPEKQPTSLSAHCFPKALIESRPSFALMVLSEEHFQIIDEHLIGQGVESDLLPNILVAIDGLMSPNENDGDPAATEHAYKSARAIVESAYGRLAEKEQQAKKLPVPIVTTDERGGVRLSWQRGDRHVRTRFAAEEGLRSYLYFESPEEHDVEALQPDILSGRLDWMLKA
jgi:hypothetical protein